MFIIASGHDPVLNAWTAQTTVTAVLAFVGGLGLWQKWRSDRRDHWWTRAQWGLQQLIDGDDVARTAGTEFLSRQLDSKLATRDDQNLLSGLMDVILDEYEPGIGEGAD